MPFSEQVKTAVLIRCDRHCCKCRKKCGTNIEAAHIVAETDGGPNAEENCIPLCFDCHADIGHYNSRHPKGNKFRPPELLAIRDATYEWVAANKAAITAATATSGPSQSPPPISEMEVGALVIVWKRKRVSALAVAFEMGISEDRAKVYLHELDQTHRLVDWFGNMDTKESTYAITHKGRRLLFNRGIVQ